MPKSANRRGPQADGAAPSRVIAAAAVACSAQSAPRLRERRWFRPPSKHDRSGSILQRPGGQTSFGRLALSNAHAQGVESPLSLPARRLSSTRLVPRDMHSDSEYACVPRDVDPIRLGGFGNLGALGGRVKTTTGVPKGSSDASNHCWCGVGLVVFGLSGRVQEPTQSGCKDTSAWRNRGLDFTDRKIDRGTSRAWDEARARS